MKNDDTIIKTLETETINKGHYLLLAIVLVYTNINTMERSSYDILTFGDYFTNESKVEKFKKSPFFKSIFKNACKYYE